MTGEERKMLRNKNFDFLIYLVFTFIILIPFLYDGYLFLIDSIPKLNYPDLLYGKIVQEYGGRFPLDMISTMIPMEVFQKLLLFLLLFLSGCSTYVFTFNIVPSSRIVSLYAGILYMVNPYMYLRIFVGHWYVSYAIFPLLLKEFIDLLENNNKKELIKFVFILTIVGFSVHFLIIAIIMMSIIYILWILRYKNYQTIKMITFAGIIFVLLNSYWTFPIITAKNIRLDDIGQKDYEAFVPNIENNIQGWFEIAAMYGFWREGYIYAKDFIPYWQLLSLFIILLAIYGFISYYKDEKIGHMVKALGVIWIIGFILATGINGPFGDIVHWLFDNTILKGFRDSHKFVAMLVLSYSVLGGLGIAKLESMRKDL